MKITKQWLKEKGACDDGIKQFVATFGEEADYQDVLNALAKERNGSAWASWLLQHAGAMTSCATRWRG